MDPQRLPSLSLDSNDASGPDLRVAAARPVDASAQPDAATAAFTPAHETITDRLAPPPSATFGRYALIRLLGQGGMGEVHLAQDTKLQRSVALKLPRFSDDNPIHRERFFREARAAANLSHRNICPVFDVGEEEGRPYLTMAYVDGPSLAHKLHHDGPLPPREAARLIRSAARGMQHAHEHGILHRDLKPGNILVNAEGEPIIMDFGLAYRFDTEVGERLTQQGLIVGTPAYMPPEQINGQSLGPTTDVYSLGVVLYELLTGKVPFSGTLGQIMLQIENVAPPAPGQVQRRIDPALETICLKALAKHPSQRFPDMAALAQALDDYLAGRFEAVLALSGPEQPKRRHWWIAAAVVAGVLAISAAVLPSVLRREQGVTEKDAPRPPTPPVEAHRDLKNREEHVKEVIDPKKREETLKTLFAQLRKPIVKVNYTVHADAPETLSRSLVPAELLKGHTGPLYFMLTGSGGGHVIDMGDQLGQSGQITNFVAGDVTVIGSYLTFVGNVDASARVYVEGGPAISLVAPMAGGVGCKHLEFDGTHILPSKINPPTFEAVPITAAEKARLRNPKLTHKVMVRYPGTSTEHVLFTRADVQFISSDPTERSKSFPEVHLLIELDRERQGTARTISDAEMRGAKK